MLLINYGAAATESFGQYAQRVYDMSVEQQRAVIAAPVGLEYGVIESLNAKGLAVRSVTLDEFDQIRQQQGVTVVDAV